MLLHSYSTLPTKQISCQEMPENHSRCHPPRHGIRLLYQVLGMIVNEIIMTITLEMRPSLLARRRSAKFPCHLPARHSRKRAQSMWKYLIGKAFRPWSRSSLGPASIFLPDPQGGSGTPARPGRFGGERHQDRLDIAAGLQTECGAAVVEQVELDVAAAADELMTALFGRPGEPHPGPHDGRENGEDGVSDRSEEGEVALPVAAIEIVEEDPAGAARLAPVRQKEVFVAPLLEAGVAAGVVGRAGAGQCRMKFVDRRRIGVDRGDVGAAAEPRLG